MYLLYRLKLMPRLAGLLPFAQWVYRRSRAICCSVACSLVAGAFSTLPSLYPPWWRYFWLQGEPIPKHSRFQCLLHVRYVGPPIQVHDCRDDGKSRRVCKRYDCASGAGRRRNWIGEGTKHADMCHRLHTVQGWAWDIRRGGHCDCMCRPFGPLSGHSFHCHRGASEKKSFSGADRTKARKEHR